MAEATKYTNVKITGTLDVTGSSNDVAMANGKQWKPDGTTATATAGAATLSKQAGVVTSESITTAAGSAYTLTLTNTLVSASSIVLVSFANGTNTQGTPALSLVTPGSGSVTIAIRNGHATQAFNGTIVISFLVLNPQ